jgi:hypothetical protein
MQMRQIYHGTPSGQSEWKLSEMRRRLAARETRDTLA